LQFLNLIFQKESLKEILWDARKELKIGTTNVDDAKRIMLQND
jgi:hypothetical protein